MKKKKKIKQLVLAKNRHFKFGTQFILKNTFLAVSARWGRVNVAVGKLSRNNSIFFVLFFQREKKNTQECNSNPRNACKNQESSDKIVATIITYTAINLFHT